MIRFIHEPHCGVIAQPYLVFKKNETQEQVLHTTKALLQYNVLDGNGHH